MSTTLSTRRKRSVLVISFFIVVGLRSCVGAGPAQGQVQVEMTLHNKSFYLGAGAPVVITAVNSGENKVMVALREKLRGASNSHLEVRNETGEPVDYIGWEENGSSASQGGRFFPLPPGEKATRRLNLAKLYRLEQPGAYKVRTYVTVAEEKIFTARKEKISVILGREKVFTPWQNFRVIPGKEAFRKDIKVIRRRRPGSEAPEREDASLIVYALPKVHVAYYKRTFQKDGNETTIYKRMMEVDPARKPRVLTDADGEVHILVAQRLLPIKEIKKRFKDSPFLHTEHLRYRHYMWYKAVASDGRLVKNRRLSMAREDKTELRLVQAANRTIEVHKSGGLGVYSPPWKKPKRRPPSSQQPRAKETSDTPKEPPARP